MTLYGEEAILAMMHVLSTPEKLRLAKEWVVVWHQEKRYGPFGDENHAMWFVRKMGWLDSYRLAYVDKPVAEEKP